MDDFPDLITSPVHVPNGFCRWEDLEVWGGAKPGAGSTVIIPSTLTMIYSGYNEEPIETLIIRGTLIFEEDEHTLLKVRTIKVEDEGRLICGHEGQPIVGSAEIVFIDGPIDPEQDPEQYSCGILADHHAEVSLWGMSRDQMVTITDIVQDGTTEVPVEYVPGNWFTGDEIVFPPAGGQTMYYQRRYPEVKHLSWTMGGNVISVSPPFALSLVPAFDGNGNADCFPGAYNLTRNVVLRSANPEGVRGHLLVTGHSKLSVDNVCFQDMGRTTDDPLDSTIFDSNGEVVHIGTNQIGRYPVHIHELEGGPGPGEVYRFRVTNSVIKRSRKWALAIHNSHCGLVEGNTIYDVQHAGIATEDGSESYTRIANNHVIYVRRGDAFWFMGIHNYIDNNSGICCFPNPVTGRGGSGFYLNPNPDANRYYTVPKPDGTSETFRWLTTPMLSFKGNTCYGTAIGVWIDHQHAAHYIEDFTCWWGYGNVVDGSAVAAYDTGGTTIYNMKARGCSLDLYGEVSTSMLYSDIQNCQVGIRDNSHRGVVLIEGCFLRNHLNQQVTLSPTAGAGPIPDVIKQTTSKNTMYQAPSGQSLRAIELMSTFHGQASRIPVVPNLVIVVGFNNDPCDNFHIYFDKQLPETIVPATTEIPDDPVFVKKGANAVGLSNQQSWDADGLAWAGGVVPPNWIYRDGIAGLVVLGV